MAQDTVFNKYGVVNDLLVEKIDTQLADLARSVFDVLVIRGIAPIEVRAVCQYLVSTIEVEMSHALLKYQMDLHQAAGKEQVG